LMKCLVLSLLVFISFVVCQPPTCSVTSNDGSSYDISELSRIGPIRASGQDDDWTYSVSICNNMIPCNICSEAGYCQMGKSLTYCVGTYNGQITGMPHGAGVELVYQEPVQGRMGRVFIYCYPNGPLVSDITAISPDKVTGYEFHFYSRAACSKIPTYPCTATASDGSSYDLIPLRDHGTLTASGDDGSWVYSVSVCRDAIQCNDDCPQAGYCQSRQQPTPQSYCVGTYQQDKITGQTGGDGVVLTYQEPKLGRAGRVIITCDPFVGLVSDITAISPEKITDYEFYFRSYAACSRTSPSSCRTTTSDGLTYDLSALKSQIPINGTDSSNVWTYSLSVCGNQIQCGSSSSGYCQNGVIDGIPQTFNVGIYGKIAGNTKEEGEGVELLYWSTEDRIGRVVIKCNPGGPLVSDKVVVSPPVKSGYEFHFSSSAACPISNTAHHKK